MLVERLVDDIRIGGQEASFERPLNVNGVDFFRPPLIHFTENLALSQCQALTERDLLHGYIVTTCWSLIRPRLHKPTDFIGPWHRGKLRANRSDISHWARLFSGRGAIVSTRIFGDKWRARFFIVVEIKRYRPWSSSIAVIQHVFTRPTRSQPLSGLLLARLWNTAQ